MFFTHSNGFLHSLRSLDEERDNDSPSESNDGSPSSTKRKKSSRSTSLRPLRLQSPEEKICYKICKLRGEETSLEWVFHGVTYWRETAGTPVLGSLVITNYRLLFLTKSNHTFVRILLS